MLIRKAIETMQGRTLKVTVVKPRNTMPVMQTVSSGIEPWFGRYVFRKIKVMDEQFVEEAIRQRDEARAVAARLFCVIENAPVPSGHDVFHTEEEADAFDQAAKWHGELFGEDGD